MPMYIMGNIKGHIYTPPALCALLRPQNYGVMVVIQMAFAHVCWILAL